MLAQIRERVAATPAAPPAVLDGLRPVFSRPARRLKKPAAPAADAA
ncbi:hypothetical protein ACF1AE_25430 [Streptomyces sp. NPDC014986]